MAPQDPPGQQPGRFAQKEPILIDLPSSDDDDDEEARDFSISSPNLAGSASFEASVPNPQQQRQETLSSNFDDEPSPSPSAAAVDASVAAGDAIPNVPDSNQNDRHWREKEAKRSSISSRARRSEPLKTPKNAAKEEDTEETWVGAFHVDSDDRSPMTEDNNDIAPQQQDTTLNEHHWREKEAKRSSRSTQLIRLASESNTTTHHEATRTNRPSSSNNVLRGLAKNRQFVVRNSNASEQIALEQSGDDESTFYDRSTFTQDAHADYLSTSTGDESEDDDETLSSGQDQYGYNDDDDVEQPPPTTSMMGSPDYDESLAVANPVSEDEAMDPNLPVAETFDAEVLEERQRARARKMRRYGLFGIMTVAVIILLVIFLVVLPNSDKDDTLVTLPPGPTPNPTASPTALPTPISEADYVRSLLPDFTLQEIDKPTVTPQSQAFDWMLNHTSLLTRYSDTRILRRFGLACLYFATDGPRWNRQDGWLNFSLHEACWEVASGFETCKFDDDNNNDGETEESSDFPALQLDGNGLAGTIPPELYFGLPSVLTLSIGQNEQVTGTISSMIGQMTELRHLFLGGNSLRGSLPSEMGLMTKLSNMIFLFNQLTGLPTRLPPNLEGLIFDNNNLNGTLPSELPPSLKYFVVYSNSLSGTLPSEFGLLSSLLNCSLENNLLSGTLPTELSGMSSLKALDCFNNSDIVGPIPSEIGLLGNLNHLHLYDNGLEGQMPSEIFSLRNLKRLDLGGNAFDSTIPTTIGLLENAVGVWLDRNPGIFGPLPSEVGSMRSLEALYLDRSSLSGPLPSEIGEADSLKYVFLYSNQLSNSLPTEIGKLTNLKLFVAHENVLTGGLPTQIGSMVDLTEIFLHENDLTGPIPESVGSLRYLKNLSLRNNRFTSTIPTTIGSLNGLSLLRLNSNDLIGLVPSEIGNVRRLGTLLLSENRLSGLVPSEMGLLSSSLFYLNISGNAFTGSLPDELCSVSTLEFDCSETFCGCSCTCGAETENESNTTASLLDTIIGIFVP